MKKTKFSFIAFMFILLLNTMAKPVISYAVFKKDEKNIVLFGDMHREEIDKINIDHTNALLKALESRKDTTPIKFLVEIEPNTIETIQKTKKLPQHVGGFGKIGELLFPYATSVKNIKNVLFLPMDMRDHEISSQINTCVDEHYNIFIKNKNSPHNLNYFIKRHYWPPTNMPSCHQYFEGLDRQKDNLKKWRDHYSVSSQEFEILNQKYVRYQKSHEKIKEMLKSINKDTKFSDALLALLNSSSDCTVAMAFKNLSEVKKTILNESDYLIQDAGLLFMVLSEQNVIAITGFDHYEEICKNLKFLGYQCQSSRKIYHYDTKTSTGTIDLDSMFENEVISALNVFSDNRSSELTSKTEEKNIERICFYCKKQELETSEKKLLRCSRCQKAWYCNQSCQRNDWEKHKKLCKK